MLARKGRSEAPRSRTTPEEIETSPEFASPHRSPQTDPEATSHEPKPAPEPAGESKRELRAKRLSQSARFAGAGMTFTGTFLVTGWLGWWLDGKFGTSPWLLLLGIAIGAAGGFYSLVLQVGGASRAEDSAE